MKSAPFAFATCSPGVEPLLKRELATVAPSLRLAFSRPGFVTFKGTEPIDIERVPPSVFARVMGLSLGRVDDVDDVRRLAGELEAIWKKPPVLAVFPRSCGAFAEMQESQRAAVERVGEELARDAAFQTEPRAGDVVLDVAVDVEEGIWLGAHRHDAHRSRFAGGLLPVALHPESPSRAYLKLEEALLRFGLPVREGHVVLELGSSPGGASLALLNRGARVVGVDPGEMDPRVVCRPGFEHRRMPAGALKKADLPRPIHWVVLDMNLAPPVSLRYLERVVGPSRSSLLGCILTLKLNEVSMVDELPAYQARVRSMGFEDVRAVHLPSNGQEVCVVGRTRRR